jgi:hypothetical protein
LPEQQQAPPESISGTAEGNMMSTKRIHILDEHGTHHAPVQSLQSQKRDGHPPEPAWLADRKIRDFNGRAVTVE